MLFIIRCLHQINLGMEIATNVDWQSTIGTSLFRELRAMCRSSNLVRVNPAKQKIVLDSRELSAI
jgi:hypothetical protein